jgi:hypothetical protein
MLDLIPDEFIIYNQKLVNFAYGLTTIDGSIALSQELFPNLET